LKDFLLKEIISARESNEQVICLYGECFPDITNVCAQHGVIKIPGHYCYEMLLGTEQFNQLIEETVGTYFLERELLINFEEYCAEPLELQDEEMRRFCFERYKRLLYIRQPQDQDLAATASDLAKFLQLSLEIKDADYSYLENKLIEVISFKKTGNHNNEKA
ncbi:MAG: DUF1638 domain-containing protein, partial [Thermodesulfobacteriota bacterium]|nr:DUF1638 domain-containing protein [Thermodesulfobacteriota bacterium]